MAGPRRAGGGGLVLAATAEFAAARIRPGPRTPAEVARMLVTSAVVPRAATAWTLVGALQLPWRLREAARAPRPGGPPRAGLLDRDGTLVVDVPDNGEPARVVPVPGAREALDALRAAGIRLAVISNQAAVGHGRLTLAQVHAVNRRIEALLGPLGPWFVCPHRPDARCGCRKPAPGLVRRAARALGVPPTRCVVIGDTGADVAAGARPGPGRSSSPRPPPARARSRAPPRARPTSGRPWRACSTGGEAAESAAPARRPPPPRELQVEVTAACNLRCRMCLVRYRPPLDRVRGSMPFDTFRRLVDALPGLERLVLQGLGEPLLAPDLVRMVAYATARGIRTGVNTNATLLTPARAEQLIRAGLDWLCVSLDGATAATYEAIRDGASFARVTDHSGALVATRRRLGRDRPRLRLVFVAMRRTVAELPALVERAAAWGVEEVRVQGLAHSFSDTDPAGGYREIRAFTAAEALWAADEPEVVACLAEARRRAAALGIALRLPGRGEAPARRAAGTPGCDWPWRAAYVTYDGQVQPCCMLMGSERGRLGDAARDGFAAVWHSDAYARFRAALLGAEPPEVCRGCALYRGVF